MNKKIILLGFTVALLLAIPLTLGLLSTQQKTTTKAQKSSTLSFSQLNGSVTVGQKFNLDIILDPGSNTVSFVKMVISYNPAYLSIANGGGFVQIGSNQYSNQFTVTLDGPTYDETSNKCVGNTCTMTISMGINPQSGQPLQGVATIASISFNPLSAPSSGTTTVSFTSGTQVLSLASTDAPSENVLSSGQATQIQIVGPTPTQTPVPTSGGGGGGGGTSPTQTPVPTSGGGGGGGGTSPTSGAIPPVCNTLTADKTSSAAAPLSSIFTVNGSDPSTTISKVTFNFGDGTVQDITSGGGIGTQSINAQINHTYQTIGSFTATATLTDANKNTSTPSSCSQVITVGSNPPTAKPQPPTQPTIPSTGPGDVIVGAGVIGAILAIAGVALFIGAL